MTIREWIAATWAEWAPGVQRGRLSIGRMEIMTRAELARIARTQGDVGAVRERQGLPMWRERGRS